jgi:hypothetical protein
LKKHYIRLVARPHSPSIPQKHMWEFIVPTSVLSLIVKMASGQGC